MRSKHYTARTNLVPRGRDPFGQQRGVSLLSCAGKIGTPGDEVAREHTHRNFLGSFFGVLLDFFHFVSFA